jgi:AAA domain
MDTVATNQISESVLELKNEYGLSIDKAGNLNAKPHHTFVRLARHADVQTIPNLPHIQTEDGIDYLVPSGIDLATRLERLSSTLLIGPVKGEAIIPPENDDWTAASAADDTRISDALFEYYRAVEDAKALDSARELLERERFWSSGLYASAGGIAEVTPMLIEGLMRKTGISVFFGDFDEFKTTVVLDIVGHVAYGFDWQGRGVQPHPVIWYALEGADEIPARVLAIEAKLRDKDTPWGNDRAPITVFDRKPDDPTAWRAQIRDTADRWDDLHRARRRVGEIPDVRIDYTDERTGEACYSEEPRYPDLGITDGDARPIIVIDTLSIALGGADEKGPAAAGFINDCLDLLKERSDLASDEDDTAKPSLSWPVAAHIIIIHHQTKTGIDFAGHRAIAANTQGLYRIHRFGKITDAERPFAGHLTPIRVKGIPRPAPLRFEVQVVPIDGTKQTAAILKDRAAELPKDLLPVIEALRQFEDGAEISPKALNECLDLVAASGAKDGAAKRKARQRCRERLEGAGIIEPVTDDGGSVLFYRLHDSGVAQ